MDNAVSFKSLITSLEVMFLENGNRHKKECLSKRIAVFLETDNMKIIRLYNRVKEAYTDRSKAVHDGIVDTLTRERLNELRNIIRDVTKKYIEKIENEISLDASATF